MGRMLNKIRVLSIKEGKKGSSIVSGSSDLLILLRNLLAIFIFSRNEERAQLIL